MCRTTSSLLCGTLLYHGTGWSFAPEEIYGPAWFSRSVEVAWHFAMRSGGPEPRVMAYLLTREVELPLINGPRDFDAFCDEHDIHPYSAEDMAAGVRRAGLPGWLVPDNYPDGDDILLVDLSTITFDHEET